MSLYPALETFSMKFFNWNSCFLLIEIKKSCFVAHKLSNRSKNENIALNWIRLNIMSTIDAITARMCSCKHKNIFLFYWCSYPDTGNEIILKGKWGKGKIQMKTFSMSFGLSDKNNPESECWWIKSFKYWNYRDSIWRSAMEKFYYSYILIKYCTFSVNASSYVDCVWIDFLQDYSLYLMKLTRYVFAITMRM